jgi:hypothetical protein
MNGNAAVGLEAQFDLTADDLKHCDFDHALEADGASDDDRFLAFPRQN